jgi:hypothetical protein
MNHSYFVVMQDFGRRGLEATVHPEDTKRNVIDMIRAGEFKPIVFIHRIQDGICEDLTEELMLEAQEEQTTA